MHRDRADVREPGRRLTLVRHGESTYNVLGLLNGDPSVDVRLTPAGRAQSEAAAARLADRAFDGAVHSGFPRMRETLGILVSRAVPTFCIADLGDVRLGIFEGRPLKDYRDWRATHSPRDAPPRGESRFDALGRYVRGFAAVATLDGDELVVVTHDVPIRFLLNARAGHDPLEGPVTHVRNAEPQTFHESEFRAAIGVMERRLAVG
ncbi:MAG: histidine phosphatase family protein [Actinobacteria bacterium]|nr:histidine phosphatase family protein [Actinomycetota bacterium]